MRRTKLSHSTTCGPGGKRGSGSSHVLYGHKSRPTEIHVSCPNCNHKAIAKKDCELEFNEFSCDISGTWSVDDWKTTCTFCARRKEGLSYANLPSLYYRDGDIFAWNRDHLLFLKLYFDGCDTSTNPYHRHKAYIRRDWLRRKSRSIQSINKLLLTT